LIVLLSIILLLCGAKKIPELARGLGTGVREFKKGTSGEADKDEVKDREEDKELPQHEVAQNGRAHAENNTTRAERAGQKH
jgi:sec-independent protein translocase protein TatA